MQKQTNKCKYKKTPNKTKHKTKTKKNPGNPPPLPLGKARSGVCRTNNY